jgi:hypothetical protein
MKSKLPVKIPILINGAEVQYKPKFTSINNSFDRIKD